MAANSFYHQVEEDIRKRRYLYDFNNYVKAVNLCGMLLKCHAQISMISEIIKVMEKTQIIHLLLTFQLSSLEKTTPKFIGKHFVIQNLNHVSFYKINSVTFALKSNCRERKGLCEVLTWQKGCYIKQTFTLNA